MIRYEIAALGARRCLPALDPWTEGVGLFLRLQRHRPEACAYAGGSEGLHSEAGWAT